MPYYIRCVDLIQTLPERLLWTSGRTWVDNTLLYKDKFYRNGAIT